MLIIPTNKSCFCSCALQWIFEFWLILSDKLCHDSHFEMQFETFSWDHSTTFFTNSIIFVFEIEWFGFYNATLFYEDKSGYLPWNGYPTTGYDMFKVVITILTGTFYIIISDKTHDLITLFHFLNNFFFEKFFTVRYRFPFMCCM